MAKKIYFCDFLHVIFVMNVTKIVNSLPFKLIVLF